MKLTSLNVTARKSSTLPAKSTTKTHTTTTPNAIPVATATPVRTAISGAERRRNQRVLLRIRANIHVALQGKNTVLDAATLSVTPQGAVVVMNQSLPAETRLVLEHSGTHQRIDCKVARPPRETSEGYHTPIEFSTPAPGFWKINFPPADARPEEA